MLAADPGIMPLDANNYASTGAILAHLQVLIRGVRINLMLTDESVGNEFKEYCKLSVKCIGS